MQVPRHERTRGARALPRSTATDLSDVSEGLNLFAASLRWAARDNVVVCPRLEHPNNIYLWYNLERRYGVEVRAMEPVGGALPIEAMAAAVDDRTRVVTFPTVSFAPGFVTDARPLVRAARAVGALTLADGAQSIGAIETDVRALGFDALACAAQKCLLSLYGFGFLYVRREVAQALVPIRHLVDDGIVLSLRRGVLRLSVGLYNDESDIERALESVRKFRSRSAVG